jgi:hypothetical protein
LKKELREAEDELAIEESNQNEEQTSLLDFNETVLNTQVCNEHVKKNENLLNTLELKKRKLLQYRVRNIHIYYFFFI